VSNWDEALAHPATWIPERDMDTIKQMHAVAQTRDITLHCSRCGRAFQGFNAPGDSVLAIECGCRVLKAPAARRLT
jgi:hypothetical protein